MILATFRKEPGHENMLNVNSISFVRCMLDPDSELSAINKGLKHLPEKLSTITGITVIVSLGVMPMVTG